MHANGRRAAGVMVVALGLAAGATAPAAAQAGPLVGFIYEGACATAPGANDRFREVGTLERVFFARTQALFADEDDIERRLGIQGGGPIYEEDEDLRVSLDQLTGSPFKVVVREGGGADAPVVACGDIAGPTIERGILRIELGPVGGSDVYGIALFEPQRGLFGDRVELTVQAQRGAEIAATPAP